MMHMERLQKLIAKSGYCSRKSGRIDQKEKLPSTAKSSEIGYKASFRDLITIGVPIFLRKSIFMMQTALRHLLDSGRKGEKKA